MSTTFTSAFADGIGATRAADRNRQPMVEHPALNNSRLWGDKV